MKNETPKTSRCWRDGKWQTDELANLAASQERELAVIMARESDIRISLDKQISASLRHLTAIHDLRSALLEIINQQPCIEGGECFYPMHDGEGNYIGQNHIQKH